ncbi:type II secretion system F family protein [Pollutimonas bauzanensis]|uniref:Type II secretory pathway, component PulF n=1 Tax=Pollutimonas bauzanensis TaxID=658167 RepID=A0A1M5YI03_9BURK|nr:type II secretion system F family protein [Pollutimonas bauzanensis]SHI11499.1 Type II secretory pathway, component PulF [Pollutimonas bauzanensis]
MNSIVRVLSAQTRQIITSFLRVATGRSRENAFKRKQRIDFYRAMYLYQRAGARKLEALRKLSETYGTHLSPPQRLGNKLYSLMGGKRIIFRPVIAAVAEAALSRSNLPLAEALKDWIPPAERAILAAGEDSGNLAGAFNMVGRFARQQGGMWAAVVGGFAYPIVLTGAVMAILYLIAGVMIPSMDVSRKAVFSPSTQLVLWIAKLVYDYWYLAIALPIVAVIAVLGSLSRWRGAWRAKADRLAPWSFYRRIHGALFLYSFAVLQKSGVPIQAALANLAASANPWLKSRITAAMYGVRQGYNLGKSFRHAGHDFPDWEALPVLESISSLSGSSDSLIEYAENWLEDTAKYIEKFSRRANAAGRTWVLGWVGLLAMTVLEIISTSFR